MSAKFKKHIEELREMSKEELEKLLNELQGRLFSLGALKNAGGQVDNPKEIREIKRNIARINYLLKNEK